jgi:enoyl-CoA hydratase/carnithine racemase
MKRDQSHPVAEDHPLFTTEKQGETLVVEFVGSPEEVLGIKLKAIQELHELFSHQRKNPSKAIVFTMKPGILSPETFQNILADHGLYSVGGRQEPSAGQASRFKLMDLIREMNSAQTLIQEIQSIDAFVVVALSGEMPLALLGTALACDYRIAPEDFMLVNRIPQTGFTPLAGLPWFLSRMLGRDKARDILMNHETISACKALELGLIDRIVHKERLKQEAVTVANHVTALPWGCRVGLKRALNLADKPLGDYLEAESSIFERSLETMISSTKVRSLENIT